MITPNCHLISFASSLLYLFFYPPSILNLSTKHLLLHPDDVIYMKHDSSLKKLLVDLITLNTQW
jgi:hypothetical protein